MSEMLVGLRERFYNERVLLSIIFIVLLSALSNRVMAQNRDELPKFIEAVALYGKGEVEEAERLFSELLSKESESDAAHYYLAKIAISKGELERAERALLTAIEIDDENSWYKNLLANLYLEIGEEERAIKLFNQLRERRPEESELYSTLIDLYIQREQFANAEEVLKDVESSIGVNEATALTRYNLLLYQKREEEAFDYLERFDQLHGTAHTSLIIGDNHATNGRDSLAKEYYLRALLFDPNYQPANFSIAELYRMEGRYDLYFEKIIPFMRDPKIKGEMKRSYMEQLLTNRGFVQTFLPQIDTMMNNLYLSNSTDSLIAYDYSLYLVQRERADEALELLSKNQLLYPESIGAYLELLSLLHYLDLWHPMLQKSEEGLKIFPLNGSLLQFKAIAQYNLNQLEEARDTFKEILATAKGDSATIVNTLTTIGDITYQLGESKEAFKYYRRAIKREPNHLPALNNYSYFLSEEGKNLKRALRMSKITIEKEPYNSTYLDTYGWILYLMGEIVEAKAIFKQALLYGGKESAAILDHYAQLLYSLKEYELALIYWRQAIAIDPVIVDQLFLKELERRVGSN